MDLQNSGKCCRLEVVALADTLFEPQETEETVRARADAQRARTKRASDPDPSQG